MQLKDSSIQIYNQQVIFTEMILRKLIVAKLVKTFSVFYGTRWYLTAIKGAGFRARWVQNTSSNLTSFINFNNIIPSMLRSSLVLTD